MHEIIPQLEVESALRFAWRGTGSRWWGEVRVANEHVLVPAGKRVECAIEDSRSPSCGLCPVPGL
jgi:hypothetical protein